MNALQSTVFTVHFDILAGGSSAASEVGVDNIRVSGDLATYYPTLAIHNTVDPRKTISVSTAL